MAISELRYKTHESWLKGREGFIGASAWPTVLGCNPFETPYQYWRRWHKLDGEKPMNSAMKAGHYLEQAVANFYEDETGAQVIKRSADEYIVVNDRKPFLGVSPDRTFWLPNMPHNNGNKGVLECKTTTMFVDADNVPQRWFVQLQAQLGVMGMQQGALAWLTQGRDFGYVNYDFDSEFFEWALGEVDKFYTDYLIGSAVPDSITVEDVMLRSPRSVEGKMIEASDEIADIVAQLKEAKVAADKASGLVDELNDKVKLYMGDGESLQYQGQTLATWKSGKEGSKFDAKRFQKEHADACAAYMVKTEGVRRFILK